MGFFLKKEIIPIVKIAMETMPSALMESGCMSFLMI